MLGLDLATGRMLWSRQVTPGDVFNSGCIAGVNGPNCPEEGERGPDYDFGSSAILVKTPQGRDLLIAGQKSGMVYALDPDRKGEIVWTQRVAKGGTIGGVQWGMASDGQNVYAAASDAYFFTKDQVCASSHPIKAAGSPLCALPREPRPGTPRLSPVDRRPAVVPRNRLR